MKNLIGGFACLVMSSILLGSCQVSKPLETEVRISINETLPVKITKDEGATFITFYTEEDYRKVFIDEMKRSLALNKVVVDNVNPQFSISFAELRLTETTTTDTVKDEKSKDNGRIFDIAEAKLKASGTLVDLSNKQAISWAADKNKNERLTSFQNPGQIIKGENKDLDEYRKKDFDKTEFYSLSGQCGQRAADAVTKAIIKQLQ